MSFHDADGDERESRGRATFLAVVLTIFFGGGIVIFLIFITGGFILDVLLIVGALVALGFLHYFLWGRGLERSVEGEREELELQRKAEEEEDASRPPWERRF
jgi:hypothetical protein